MSKLMYDLQRSQGGELLKGARLYPPDLVMLQASAKTHTHTQYIKWKWKRCVRYVCGGVVGLNYAHLLQRRAAVKAGQMLDLVVGQLPATMHKAHKQ